MLGGEGGIIPPSKKRASMLPCGEAILKGKTSSVRLDSLSEKLLFPEKLAIYPYITTLALSLKSKISKYSVLSIIIIYAEDLLSYFF